jgi:putative PIN family toxin of toxin-antitoxin system
VRAGKSKPRVVVLDSNILISAVAFPGKPRSILERAIRGEFRLALSDPILEEVEAVLSGKKFLFPGRMVRFIMNELEALADFVEPKSAIELVHEDLDDNRILECAVEAGADVIVTGDEHLLRLREVLGILIVSADEFLKKR